MEAVNKLEKYIDELDKFYKKSIKEYKETIKEYEEMIEELKEQNKELFKKYLKCKYKSIDILEKYIDNELNMKDSEEIIKELIVDEYDE